MYALKESCPDQWTNGSRKCSHSIYRKLPKLSLQSSTSRDENIFSMTVKRQAENCLEQCLKQPSMLQNHDEAKKESIATGSKMGLNASMAGKSDDRWANYQK